LVLDTADSVTRFEAKPPSGAAAIAPRSRRQAAPGDRHGRDEVGQDQSRPG
jgi:hypothetical protein